jgi:hypothetical protein
MDQIDLAIMARRHWEKWLPEKSRALKEAGKFNQAIQTAAADAQRAIRVLRQLGYQEDEAGQIALPQYILLRPEPKNDWKGRDRAARERACQRIMNSREQR